MYEESFIVVAPYLLCYMETYECLKLDNQLCFPLYACAKEIVRQYRKPLDELKLTYTQYLVMMVLWETGETTEGEFGRKIRLDSGTLAPLLKRLEKQGYIERYRPGNNERQLFVKLTDEGGSAQRESGEGTCSDGSLYRPSRG